MILSPTEPDDTRDDVADLIEAIPRLARARRLADAIGGMRFFTRLGARLDRADRALARLHLDGLGFVDAEPALVASWLEAADAAMTLDFDSEGWTADELDRAALAEAARQKLDDEALNAGLSLVAERAVKAAERSAKAVDALWDVGDDALLRAASGSAVRAAHTAALALLAADDDEPDHPTLARFRLFARGRWPIGLTGRTLNIF